MPPRTGSGSVLRMISVARSVAVVGTLLAGVLLAWTPCADAQSQEPVGEISIVRGGAFVEREGSSHNLRAGDAVNERDRIVTGRGARLVLELRDGTVVSLGERTEFSVRSYGRRDDDGGRVLELLRGAFRAVTGTLNQRGGSALEVRTPVADIGVRGTDFWGGFHFSDALDVALLGGGPITIENAAGRVEIATPGSGTTVTAADVAPSTPKPWGEGKLRAAAEATATH